MCSTWRCSFTVRYQVVDVRTEAERLCALHPGIYAERKLGYENAPFHWEWYDLAMRQSRLAVIAPREFAKSEVFSVVTTSHWVVYRPGSWQYLFSATQDQAKLLLERVVRTVSLTDPWLLDRTPKFTTTDVIFANYSRVSVASVGKAMRGIHPDRIVGDDVLTEENTATSDQRQKMWSWWFGSVAPMAHPGTDRLLTWGLSSAHRPGLVKKRWPPTKIVLVGTPFHQLDLLMGMRENPLYVFRRYSAVFDRSQLVPGTWAVEARGALPDVAEAA